MMFSRAISSRARDSGTPLSFSRYWTASFM